MSVRRYQVVVHIQKTQQADNSPRCQIVTVPYISLNEIQRLELCAEAAPVDGHRFFHPDGIGDLDFTLLRISRLHNVAVFFNL